MSLLGGLGDILFGGGLFGYGDPSNMANAAQQQQQYAGQQAYHDQLRRYMEQSQQYQQTATPKPASDDNIIDAEFTVMEIDGRKLLDSDNKS